jgi:hypothetical protein
VVSAKNQIRSVTRARHGNFAPAVLEFPTLVGHRGGGCRTASDRAEKRPGGAVWQDGDSVSRGRSGFYRKGSDMTHIGCPNCRLRFTAAGAAYLDGCPQCGQSPQPIAGARAVIGFRLFAPEDAPMGPPQPVSVSIRVREMDAGRA